MPLVKENAVVVLTTGIATTTRMLSVLAHTTVASSDVAALVAVLLQSRGLRAMKASAQEEEEGDTNT